ncbi:acetyltransferase [Chitinophaga deserti]|uniref:acetyltransferase n=1 Tax=Chitinophaga deserti TaxID=2164099 RepID=UPI000D6CD2CE|nr:acetyltransferase [Chitinophaga deserti]
MKRKLILVGGGGHAKSCIATIENSDEWELHGILDQSSRIGTAILGYPVIGSDSDIATLAKEDYWFLIAVGQINDPAVRIKCYNQLCNVNARIATVISNFAQMSRFAEIGQGTIVLHGAKINADAKTGVNCIINTNANIEHDAQIGDHVHISTGAIINGGCRIGNGVFIGSGAVIVQGVTIPDNTVIGAGTVIYKNVQEKGVYAPAPFIRIK